MLEGAPVQDFSRWDGTPFFAGHPEQGRRIYLDRREEGFMAYGVLDPAPRFVFRVRGANTEELNRFLDQVKDERVQVTHGPPPFEVKSGGDKPPPSDGSPGGYKGGKPK